MSFPFNYVATFRFGSIGSDVSNSNGSSELWQTNGGGLPTWVLSDVTQGRIQNRVDTTEQASINYTTGFDRLAFDLPWVLATNFKTDTQALSINPIVLVLTLDANVTAVDNNNDFAIRLKLVKSSATAMLATVSVRGGTSHSFPFSVPDNVFQTIALSHTGTGHYSLSISGNPTVLFTDVMPRHDNGSYLTISANGASSAETPSPSWTVDIIQLQGDKELRVTDVIKSEGDVTTAYWYFDGPATKTGVPTQLRLESEAGAMTPTAATQSDTNILLLTYPAEVANRQWSVYSAVTNLTQAAQIRIPQDGIVENP